MSILRVFEIPDLVVYVRANVINFVIVTPIHSKSIITMPY